MGIKLDQTNYKATATDFEQFFEQKFKYLLRVQYVLICWSRAIVFQSKKEFFGQNTW